MEKLSRWTRTSICRAAIGFVGTASVLLGTNLLAPDASAAPAMHYSGTSIAAH
ncbi:hypothetical protein [Sphingomonas cavernae]|uniref:hypothetical protein n=1 Tax=Sphingomonas cavernae TaxID=2320861 RepID=UPI001603FA34|nr:hypothetical protein [Sphingomonas cavernae]